MVKHINGQVIELEHRKGSICPDCKGIILMRLERKVISMNRF